jgi:hypothetical protein
MVITEEQLIKEFKGILERLAYPLENQKNILAENNRLLTRILEWQEKKEDKPIANEVSIPYNDEKEYEINNPGFNRARVFLSALFTPAHTGGITVDLYYGNSRMSRVLKLISSNGTATGASEPVDIAYLSGFKFIVHNHDTSQNTVIRNFKIVMYNEA